MILREGENMNIYYYDIWDGNKGIIIAKDEDEAIKIFRNNEEYKDIPLYDVDTNEYDSGICRIDFVCKYDESPVLVPIE